MKNFSLSIASYNIKHGADVGFDMAPFAQNILDQSIDVVGVQEVDKNASRSQKIDTMRLLSLHTGYPNYRFFKTIPLGDEGEYGLGILSKYPILESELIPLDSAGAKEQRVLGRALIDVDGIHINFFVTHLSHDSDTTRARQFDQIAAILKSYGDFVLTGDFNTSNFDEYAVIEYAGAVNNASHSVATFPKTNASIDNIVYSAETWEFSAPRILTASHSDHYMLYATGNFLKR